MYWDLKSYLTAVLCGCCNERILGGGGGGGGRVVKPHILVNITIMMTMRTMAVMTMVKTGDFGAVKDTCHESKPKP